MNSTSVNVNQYCGGGDIATTLENIKDSSGIPSMTDYPYPDITNCTNNTTCTDANGNVQIGQQNCNVGSPVLYRSYYNHWESTKLFVRSVQNVGFDQKTMPGTSVPVSTSDPDGSGYWKFGIDDLTIMDNQEKIRAHVYAEGPLVVGYSVFPDFFSYNEANRFAVYKPTPVSKTIEGGHCVMIVGYGINEDGVRYWEIQNSWGDSWGDQGFFYFIRGINYCGIESTAVGSLVLSDAEAVPPDLPYMPNQTPPNCPTTGGPVFGGTRETNDMSLPSMDLNGNVIIQNERHKPLGSSKGSSIVLYFIIIILIFAFCLGLMLMNQRRR
jgi:hypothetical protein